MQLCRGGSCHQQLLSPDVLWPSCQPVGACCWALLVKSGAVRDGRTPPRGGEADGLTTYYDMIARDKEVVKMVLLLTGSIEGMKENVLQYIGHFNQYSFLWQKDLATEYAAFMSTSPSLEVRTWP